MFKLLKLLKGSTIALIITIALLTIQAQTDLALPSYTSDIINVGIMKNGISSIVPDVIRKTELDKLTVFMSEAEQEIILPHYSLLRSEDYSGQEWNKLLDKYPLLSTEEIYAWDGEEEEALADAFSTPMLLVLGLTSDSEESVQMQQALLANIPAQFQPSGADLIQIITSLPEEFKVNLINGIRSQMEQMTDIITSGSAISYTKSEYQAIGINVNKMQTNYILFSGSKMLGLALVGMLAAILVTLVSSRIAGKLGRDLRSRVFEKVLSFSNKEMDQFSTASLITRSTNDIQQVQNMIVMLIRIVIYSPILAVGGVIKALRTSTSMSWIMALGVGAVFVLIGILFIVAMPKFKIMQNLVDRINLVTRETLTGLPVIRAFSTEEHEKDRFDKANLDVTKNSLFVNRTMAFMFPTLFFIMNVVSILIIWVGAKGIDAGSIQIGDMIAFISYAMQIIMSFLMLTLISVMLPRASVAAKRIDEILSTEASIQDPAEDTAPNTASKGVLEFRNVSFRYPNAEEDVLSNISFVARPGETTAIIGSTGSGKSTLINLIPRFYDVTDGVILLDGVDIRKMKLNTLRSKLGFIPQKGVLFTGTIESNIKFGNTEASEEEMKRAARIAQAEEFINNKPEGYASDISQGGTNVSGGQKQRLAIARAIAKNPDIYVFDDSFSALDFKTDARLRKALKEEISDSTVIIVAQRISTIMNAEQILVLDDGKIVGKGTHKELLKNCEVYQQIASSQLSKEELENE